MSKSRPTDFRSGFIAIVGETNAGKSTLLNAILGKKLSIVSAKPHTTRNRILGVKHLPHAQLIFVDTPGFVGNSKAGPMGKFTSRVLQDATAGVDLVLLVVDANVLARNLAKVAAIPLELQERKLGRPAVIVLNKVDLVAKPLLLPLLEKLSAEFAAGQNETVELVPVSALRGDGLDVVEQLIVDRLPLGERLFPTDVDTDQSEEFMTAEIVREKLLPKLHQELPHSVAVKIEGWEEDEELIKIQAAVLVEKDSQKAIVIGKGGSRLKEIGQAAREELEASFGQKVFLKLFVKVEPEWTKTERGLERAGYNNVF
ncbi:MAG: GTPase Era [Bdellovibrionota bacterium]